MYVALLGGKGILGKRHRANPYGYKSDHVWSEIYLKQASIWETMQMYKYTEYIVPNSDHVTTSKSHVDKSSSSILSHITQNKLSS